MPIVSPTIQKFFDKERVSASQVGGSKVSNTSFLGTIQVANLTLDDLYGQTRVSVDTVIHGIDVYFNGFDTEVPATAAVDMGFKKLDGSDINPTANKTILDGYLLVDPTTTYTKRRVRYFKPTSIETIGEPVWRIVGLTERPSSYTEVLFTTNLAELPTTPTGGQIAVALKLSKLKT